MLARERMVEDYATKNTRVTVYSGAKLLII